jgi:hypothetical protein
MTFGHREAEVMAGETWTWDPQAHPRIVSLLADSAGGVGWCMRLDRDLRDPVVGKILCVCAAAGVAREVLAVGPGFGPAAANLPDDAIVDSNTPMSVRFQLKILGAGFFDEKGLGMERSR